MKKAISLTCIVLLLTGCSSIESDVVGTWEKRKDDGSCETYLEDGFRINEDGTIEGVEGFKKYEIEKGNKDYDYMILDGTEDLTRFKIRMKDKNKLEIVNESEKEGFEALLACDMKRVDE